MKRSKLIHVYNIYIFSISQRTVFDLNQHIGIHCNFLCSKQFKGYWSIKVKSDSCVWQQAKSEKSGQSFTLAKYFLHFTFETNVNKETFPLGTISLLFSSSCIAKSLKPHSVFFTQCWHRGYTRKIWSSRDRASSLSSFRRHLPCGRLYDRHTVDGIDRFFTWCLWISTRTRLSFPPASSLFFANKKWKTACNNKEKSHQNSRNNSHRFLVAKPTLSATKAW